MEVQSPRHWTSRKFPGNEWRFKHKRPFLSSRILQRRRLTSKWVLYLLVMSIKTGVLGSCGRGTKSSLGQRVSSSGSWWLSWVLKTRSEGRSISSRWDIEGTMWRGCEAWRPRYDQIWKALCAAWVVGLHCTLATTVACHEMPFHRGESWWPWTVTQKSREESEQCTFSGEGWQDGERTQDREWLQRSGWVARTRAVLWADLIWVEIPLSQIRKHILSLHFSVISIILKFKLVFLVFWYQIPFDHHQQSLSLQTWLRQWQLCSNFPCRSCHFSSSQPSGMALILFTLEVKKLRLRKMKNLLRVLQSDKAGLQTKPSALGEVPLQILVFVGRANSSLSYPHPCFIINCWLII